MAAEPVFAVFPRVGFNIATSGSADMGGTVQPSGLVSIITAGASGTRISEVTCKIAASGTSQASLVRLFLVNQSNWMLYDELVLNTTTSSSNSPSSRFVARYDNLILPSPSWSLQATTSVSQPTHVIALGADL